MSRQILDDLGVSAFCESMAMMMHSGIATDEAVGLLLSDSKSSEGVLQQGLKIMKEQVNRFRALGFRVWMDDFGSGYSSLDALQSFRFDLIKFNMRFQRRQPTERRAACAEDLYRKQNTWYKYIKCLMSQCIQMYCNIPRRKPG